MVEPGDTVSATLKKEFGEEAMNSLEATEEEKKKLEEHIDTLFHNGEEVKQQQTDTLGPAIFLVTGILKVLGSLV